jgi:uncharacterized protein with FMN-binding domain
MADNPTSTSRAAAIKPTNRMPRTISCRDFLGSNRYITVAVDISKNGIVKQIEIMEYKECYGYEVREPVWHAQFVGKSANSPLQLGVDIKNIGGATLSSKHITNGVKRILEKYASQKGRS